MQVKNLALHSVPLLIPRNCYKDYFVNLEIIGFMLWAFFLLEGEVDLPSPHLVSTVMTVTGTDY